MGILLIQDVRNFVLSRFGLPRVDCILINTKIGSTVGTTVGFKIVKLLTKRTIQKKNSVSSFYRNPCLNSNEVKNASFY